MLFLNLLLLNCAFSTKSSAKRQPKSIPELFEEFLSDDELFLEVSHYENYNSTPKVYKRLVGMDGAKEFEDLILSNDERLIDSPGDSRLLVNRKAPYPEAYGGLTWRCKLFSTKSFVSLLSLPVSRKYNILSFTKEDVGMLENMIEKAKAFVNDRQNREKIADVVGANLKRCKCNLTERFNTDRERFVDKISSADLGFYVHPHPHHSVGYFHIHVYVNSMRTNDLHDPHSLALEEIIEYLRKR